MQKLTLEARKKMEEEKRKKEKEIQIKIRLEATQKLAEADREWKKVRPDETLDDLCECLMPAPTKVETRIPQELIGDCLKIIEFHQTYAGAFGDIMFSGTLKKLSLADMETVIFEQSTSGMYCDLIFFYIQALRYCWENELTESGCTACPFIGLGEVPDVDGSHWPVGDAYIADELCNRSTHVAHWGVKTLGHPILDLQVDEITVTEVVRLLVLSSASYMHGDIAGYRGQYRGGWGNEEDPLLQTLMSDENIKLFIKMETESVYSLSPKERLQLIGILTDAVISQPDGRQVIDEADDEMKNIRKEIIELQKNENIRKSKHKKQVADLNSAVKEILKNEQEQQNGAARPLRGANFDLMKEEKAVEIEAAGMNSKKEQELFEERLEKLQEELNAVTLRIRTVLLGTDRFHRRYWLFASIPGIMVEVPTELPPISSGDSWETFKLPKFQKRPTLKDFMPVKVENATNGVTNGMAPVSNNTPNGITTSTDRVKEPQKMEVDQDENAVKTEEELEKKRHWSFVPNCGGTEWFNLQSETAIRELHSALNPRGEREKGLLESLRKYFNYITANVSKKFTFTAKSDKEESPLLATDKDILSCRDYILDIEERIFAADFGDAFNDEEQREQWREFWKYRELKNDVDFLALLDPEKSTLDHLKGQKELPEEMEFPIHLNLDEVGEEASQRIKEVRNLAASVVVMERALCLAKGLPINSNKILTRPLFFNSRSLSGKKKKPDETGWKNTLFYQNKNWEASILNCKSGSALYLHIIHLDECIMWAKSPENIRCSICRRKTDAEKMLICDGCDKAYHTFCHKPKVRFIPDGDWFCKHCAAKQQQEQSPRKSRRKTTLDEDGSDSDDEPLLSQKRKKRKVDYTEARINGRL